MTHKCSLCGKKTRRVKSVMPDGIPYEYYKCECGEEILDMGQLNAVAQKYRKMKKHNAKLSKWGQSLGLRIPKELTEKYNMKEKNTVQIIEEKDGLKLIIA